MLAQINPAALPALRIAATFFLTVNIVAAIGPAAKLSCHWEP
jgi:hypothetical protein